MSAPQTPVFPLNLPLFPGCQMPLQIFEPRYLDMIPRCMKTGSGFVVALLKPGAEKQEVRNPGTGERQVPCYSIGTMARIVDFGQRDNGLLAITIEGEQRQRLSQTHCQDDGLWLAHAEALPETSIEHTYELAEMAPLLKRLLSMSGLTEIEKTVDFASSQQVIHYLVMLLPFDNGIKQSLLEIDDQSIRMQLAIEKIKALEISGEEQLC